MEIMYYAVCVLMCLCGAQRICQGDMVFAVVFLALALVCLWKAGAFEPEN